MAEIDTEVVRLPSFLATNVALGSNVVTEYKGSSEGVISVFNKSEAILKVVGVSDIQLEEVIR